MSGRPRKYDHLLQQFSQGEPTAFMEVGEPEVIKTAPPPPPEEPSELGLMERFAQGAREMGRGALYGASQGMMLGGADEAEAAARVAAGDDWQPAIDQARADMRGAQADAPWTFEAARMAGSIPGAMYGGARTLAAKIGLPVAEGALGGALSSDSDDWRQTAEDAAGGGLIGAAFQAAPELAAAGSKWVGNKARAIGDWMQNASYETRNSALGGTSGQFQTLAREKGLDYVEGGLGESVERQGLTNRWKPQSPSDYARKAAEAEGIDPSTMQKTGGGAIARKDQALANAANELAPDFLPSADLEQGIRGLKSTVSGAQGVGLNRDPMRSNYDALADQVPQQLPKYMTPGQLDEAKMAYYEQGYPENISATSDRYGAQAHQGAGRVAKDQLHDAMRHTLPDTEAQFFGANQDIGELSTIHKMARDAAGRSAGGRANTIANIAGATAGAMGGALAGGAVGAVPGIALGGLAGNKLYGAAREYGPDLAANLLARGAEGMGAFASPAVQSVTSAGLMQRFADSSAPRAGGNFTASGDSSAYERSIGDGRGYMLAETVQDVLRTDPQSLGPYAQQFADAMASPRPGAMNALLSRLSQTDETWRRQYLPALRQRTSGGEGY